MTIAFTIVNIPYLPVAKALADSFVTHNPEVPLYICLFDDQDDIQDAMFLDYHIYDKSHLNKEEYDDMRHRYDNFSMACALKPFFAEALLRDFDPEHIVYLDADLMFFDSLTKLDEVLNIQQKSIVLTGHQYTVIPSENELSNNQTLRKYGIYNAGFIALKNNAVGQQFLAWWKRILFTKCIRDDENGIYYDQTWLDLVPMYFGDDFYMLKDLGYNVAFWNLEERHLSAKGGNYFINEHYPLVFYHFARYKYYKPEFINGFYMRFEGQDSLFEIFTTYRKNLKQNLFEEYHKEPIAKRPTFIDKLKISLKYRLGLIVDKL
ncbi:hypothetical protein [Chryseobacterium sp. SC28]|uniref:hypothetical protein n=1 Tax=Chryseobacterium sp. SC28 TaxID=2268028 RepID=UPI000F64DFD5|nr:hypothetical protein [Chryseobacterium sp. SC28]RRQ45847.1 hypothetical protein DTW91_07980 [Chryseobacterium sp. SC28]